MKKILVLGAGRSTYSLINYLLEQAGQRQWKVRVGDHSLAMAEEKCGAHELGEPFRFDVNDEAQQRKEIAAADLVISMLPAAFHPLVAQRCIEYGVNMVTASYVAPEMRTLEQQAREKGILILNECGLDPGIDHMSAMKVIDQVRENGGELTAFETFTGGLLAPGEGRKSMGIQVHLEPSECRIGRARYCEIRTAKQIQIHSLPQTVQKDRTGICTWARVLRRLCQS